MKLLDKYGVWIILAIIAYEIYKARSRPSLPVGAGTVDIPGFYDNVPGGAAAYNPDTVDVSSGY